MTHFLIVGARKDHKILLNINKFYYFGFIRETLWNKREELRYE